MNNLFFRFLIALFILPIALFLNGCEEDKNEAPTITITNPLPGSSFIQGEIVNISIDANDVDGSISEVRIALDDIGLTSILSYPYNYEMTTSNISIGNHTIKATAIDNESIETSSDISIVIETPMDVPSPDFEVNSTTVYQGDTVIFTDLTLNNPTVWLWSFGDGAISNIQNPIHVYDVLGEFDVSLTCSNSTGSDIEIKLEYITVVEPPSENSFTDVRDGKIYEYVEIGTQTWMAENLSYNHPLSKVSGNIPSREAIYGRLYDWETAKTVCPDGWHLPNHVEWFQFMNFTSWSATGIKEEGTEHWANPNDGDNYYGFTALGGGKHSSASSSQDFKTHAYFWCSDLYNPTQDGEIYILKHDEPSVSYDYAYSSVHGSVRCIKN